MKVEFAAVGITGAWLSFGMRDSNLEFVLQSLNGCLDAPEVMSAGSFKFNGNDTPAGGSFVVRGQQ